MLSNILRDIEENCGAVLACFYVIAYSFDDSALLLHAYFESRTDDRKSVHGPSLLC